MLDILIHCMYRYINESLYQIRECVTLKESKYDNRKAKLVRTIKSF